MRVLHFSVNEQNIKKSGDFSGIVKGSKGYLKAERFGNTYRYTPLVKQEEYTSNSVAAASFFTEGKEYAVPIIRNRCIVPDDVTDADYFRVQVVGLEKGQIIKTNKVLVRQEG